MPPHRQVGIAPRAYLGNAAADLFVLAAFAQASADLSVRPDGSPWLLVRAAAALAQRRSLRLGRGALDVGGRESGARPMDALGIAPTLAGMASSPPGAAEVTPPPDERRSRGRSLLRRALDLLVLFLGVGAGAAGLAALAAAGDDFDDGLVPFGAVVRFGLGARLAA